MPVAREVLAPRSVELQVSQKDMAEGYDRPGSESSGQVVLGMLYGYEVRIRLCYNLACTAETDSSQAVCVIPVEHV